MNPPPRNNHFHLSFFIVNRRADRRGSTSDEVVSQTAIANFLIVARSQREVLAVTDDRFR